MNWAAYRIIQEALTSVTWHSPAPPQIGGEDQADAAPAQDSMLRSGAAATLAMGRLASSAFHLGRALSDGAAQGNVPV